MNLGSIIPIRVSLKIDPTRVSLLTSVGSILRDTSMGIIDPKYHECGILVPTHAQYSKQFNFRTQFSETSPVTVLSHLHTTLNMNEYLFYYNAMIGQG